MKPRLILEHDRPRACGGASKSRDRLWRVRSGYIIEWSSPHDPRPEQEDPEITTHYRDAASALADWLQFPRKGERLVGRQPRGFAQARRKAKEG